ncbi:MAG: 3-hydroxyacyl-CoA dehydrogenase NAD-binding domain-containing protein, partial [Hyphomonadaceae bacterium]|nr:3-hydroxyacyl-CoA dehydrogenase NAD-binding domain-containing protein [Hyphomonadaceae bacterium]
VISTKKMGDVLVVVSDNPPVNALGAAVRAGLKDAIVQAKADPEVKAVVVRGEGRTFFAGADITEFGKPPKDPQFAELIDLFETCPKPIVAAIHGTALGGGLEIALACHYRVAVPSAKLGLPEVKLGILPGAGGTQRLPRVVGVEAALNMIVFGDPISAKKAEASGLLDALVGEASLEDDAVAFAREVAKKSSHPITSQRSDKVTGVPASVFDDFRKANARKLKGQDAPQACVEAVQAATTMPFAEGCAKERELFLKLVGGVQSRALRHAFFAERAAGKIEGVSSDTPLIPIKKVGVLGAGTMGGGIAMNFLSAGFPVTIVEREQAALDRGVAIIRKNYEATASKGRMTAEQVEKAMSLLTPSLNYEDLADSDLVIEAVFELMEIKKEVFRKLDGIVKQGAILATNTSYLDVDQIAAETRRPEYVLGTHFFSPANVMKLLEIVRGAKTSPSVLATLMGVAKKINKVAVVAGVCYGFIGNRMLSPRQREANALLMEGARPAQVDQVLLDFGFPMGPFQMSDLAGLDIGWDPAKSSSSTIREVLCERGRRGQKTGKGFYDYDEKRNRAPSPEVDEIIAAFAAKTGKPQRQISDDEIRERLLYPMVNEGALILEEGIAQRASDIDTTWLNGYGWPPYTGGPMFWADTVGLDKVLAGLEKHAANMPDLRISKLLREKAAKGETFN